MTVPANARPEARLRTPAGGFHLVVAGRCLMEIDDELPFTLEAGDLLVTTGTPGMTLRDSETTTPRLMFDVIPLPDRPDAPRRDIRAGGDGPVTSLIGGGFFFDSPHADRLLPALPTFIHVRGAETPDRWTELLLPMLLGELSTMGDGGQAVVDHLASVLFVKAVRHYLARMEADGPTNFLRALLDPEVGQALRAIHRDPAAPWSVASLADHVLMSRSAFAARFTQLVGQPPMNYLTQCRMNRAQDLLKRGSVSVKDIAHRVGYESEAAFSNAYKRHVGVSPRITRSTGHAGFPGSAGAVLTRSE